MRTVNDYKDVHGMKPVSLPVFSIASEERTVLVEIEISELDNCSITENSISITTKNFFYINNPDWNKINDVEHFFDIVYSQIFINEITGESVMLEKTYHKYYLDSFSSFSSISSDSTTFSYYFYNENLHQLNKGERD